MSELSATPIDRRLLLQVALMSGSAAIAPWLAACGNGSESDPRPIDQATTTAATLSPPEAPDPTRKASYNEIVRGLGGIEERCGRAIFAAPMVFFDIPATNSELQEYMEWHPGTLTQIEEAGFNRGPIVVLEPTDASLSNLGVARAKTTAWAAAMSKHGIRPEQLGRVVIEPEPIVGGLAGSNPDRFVASVKNYHTALTESLPGTETTILIDTAPEEHRRLIAMLHEQRRNLPIASVGVQAFANAAPIPFNVNGRPDLSRYLTADTIIEIADAAATETVWLNTGIIRKDQNIYSRGSYSTTQREAIANALADVVHEVRTRGVNLDSVVLFAEDKLQKPAKKPERRDFSFHHGDEQVLITLHDRLRAMGVSLFGFDIA